MEHQRTNAGWLAIAKSLGDFRDSLTLLSLCLKDHMADAPSLEHDAMTRQVEAQLSRIFEAERRTFE